MDNAVRQRYSLCRKCLECHGSKVEDIFMRSIILNAIKHIDTVLYEGTYGDWKNFVSVSARDSGVSEGFDFTDSEICNDCKFKLEHIVTEN